MQGTLNERRREYNAVVEEELIDYNDETGGEDISDQINLSSDNDLGGHTLLSFTR